MQTTESLSEIVRVPKLTPLPLRILIAEDQTSWQTILTSSLRLINPNSEAVCVKNVDEARQLLKDDSDFDLIIADHYLEGTQTGIDLWRFCRREHRDIPFMMTSGLERDEFLDCLENQTIRPAFLQKPFKLKHLQATMEWVQDMQPALPIMAPITTSMMMPRDKIVSDISVNQRAQLEPSVGRWMMALLGIFGSVAIYSGLRNPEGNMIRVVPMAAARNAVSQSESNGSLPRLPAGTSPKLEPAVTPTRFLKPELIEQTKRSASESDAWLKTIQKER